MFNMAKMMKQAQQMQYKLQEVQEKLKDIEIEAESGGGLVKIAMTCAGKATNVQIDPSLLESDKETLEDLITAAINHANEVKDEKIKVETKAMMEGLDLPEEMMQGGQGGGLPF